MPLSNPPAPAPSSRSFLSGVLCAFLVGMGVVAFLNWWQNPFYAFEPALPHLSERPPGAILGADRERQMRWLIRQGEHLDADTLLIGSSQFLMGMDTCQYPKMKRLALFFLTDDEITRMLAATVPNLHTQTTFLISRGLVAPRASPPSVGKLHALWRDLFGQQATYTSLLNLYGSIAPGPRPCAVVADAATAPDAKSPEMIRKTLEVAARHIAPPTALADIFATIEPQCSRLHHRIVILHMPILFSPSDVPALLSLTQQQAVMAREAVAAFNQRHTGCVASFQDLATQYTLQNQQNGPDQADWMDSLHFRPELGQKFLTRILAGAGDGSGTTALPRL
ncbi:MAG: hypothetical protein ACRYF4_10840 [Janthinobacterium lividum]